MARNKIALIGGGNIGGVLAQEAAFRELGDVVMKALEKDRDRRYASMASFADDLSRFLANQPIQPSVDRNGAAFRMAPR